MPNNQKTKAIADPDIRNSGISERSDAILEGGSRKASAEELAFALEALEIRNAEIFSRHFVKFKFFISLVFRLFSY